VVNFDKGNAAFNVLLAAGRQASYNSHQISKSKAKRKPVLLTWPQVLPRHLKKTSPRPKFGGKTVEFKNPG
jgi:hypothetical protein